MRALLDYNEITADALVFSHRLIAIMLGQLHMSTEQALDAYTKIAKCIFHKNKHNKDGLFNEDALATAIRNFLMEFDKDKNDSEECMLVEGKDGKTQLGNRYAYYLPRLNVFLTFLQLYLHC